MPLNPDYILSYPFQPIEARITDDDVMFYALSIGIGRDPLDPWDLRYVYEQDLKVFPTMPLVIGHPGNWMIDPQTGITRTMVVHGGQRLQRFKDLPIGGTVVSTNRVAAVWDKGDKGAILDLVRETFDKATGDLIARSESSVFCRADGGFGGEAGPQPVNIVPEGPAHRSAEAPTDASMALLYRLNNDRNPLHADPAVAARAGFSRPILHGLATYGVAAAAIARSRPDQTLTSIGARFSRPVLPGDTIAVDMWDAEDGILFQARVGEKVVLDRGRALLA
jgi:acyl dehydratase